MGSEAGDGGVSEEVVEGIVTQWKEKGNAQLKAGDAAAAAESYGTGLSLAGACPAQLRSQLLSNRAQAWLLLGKDEDAVSDSRLSIQDDAKNAKAYWRGATAAMRLQKHEDAKDFCDKGLAALGDNAALKGLLEQAERQLAIRAPGDAELDCAICLQPLAGRGETVTLSCKHTLHRDCASELRSQGASELCPRCRAVGGRARGTGSAGLLDEALTHYVRSTAGSPGKVPKSGAAADEAAKLFATILEEEPDCAAAARALGCLHAAGACAQASALRWPELWERAASLGDEGAQFLLGQKLDTGDGVAQDRAQALELWERAAGADHAAASYHLGMRLQKGDGVKEDKARAARLWERAAAHGHPAALFSLGLAYETGNGVGKDAVKALELWGRAARNGHAAAQFYLGAKYDRGDGVPQDQKMAADFWALAASQGHAVAQFNLGVKFYNGDGVDEDLDRAAELWEQAAAQGHAEAARNLSLLLSDG